jgi:hypothetical protein
VRSWNSKRFVDRLIQVERERMAGFVSMVEGAEALCRCANILELKTQSTISEVQKKMQSCILGPSNPNQQNVL